MKGIAAMIASGRKLQIASWNVAAINNNPFEYWITYNEPYEKLMSDVEVFLEAPGDRDVPVSHVFDESMFSQLDGRMQNVGWDSVRSNWLMESEQSTEHYGKGCDRCDYSACVTR